MDVVRSEVSSKVQSNTTKLGQHDAMLEAIQEGQESMQKVLERLSLVVIGDENVPNYKGLAERVANLEVVHTEAAAAHVKFHAKLAGIWGTVTAVVVPLATLLAKIMWHVDVSGIVGTPAR
jgi:hypothetical protein